MISYSEYYGISDKDNRNRIMKSGQLFFMFASKLEFHLFIKNVPGNESFYPKSVLINSSNNIPKIDSHKLVLKPCEGGTQDGVNILYNDENLEYNIRRHMIDYSKYKTWIVQEYIHSFLAKLPGDNIGRKNVLRTYFYIDTLKQSGGNVYIYNDIIATIFRKEYTGSLDKYENVNLNTTYYKEQLGRQMGNRDKNDNYKSLKELVSENDYHKIFEKTAHIVKALFDKIRNDYIINTVHINNIFAIDWILDNDHNIYLLEINTRPTLGMYSNVISPKQLIDSVKNIKLKHKNNDLLCLDCFLHT